MMSTDNENNYIDETSEEELKKVEEMLKSSRRERQKMNSSKKPQKSDKKDDKDSFVSKLTKNPVIPITALLLIAVLALGVFYFAPRLKKDKVDSIGITYETLRTNYVNTKLYKELFKDFDCKLPDMQVTEPQEGSKHTKELNFFAMKVNNGFTTLNVGIQGSTRKSDGEIVALRFLFEDTTDQNESQNVLISVLMYYRMVFNSVFPELTDEEATTLLNNGISAGTFQIKDNIAYRIGRDTIDGKNYYIMDFAPATQYQSENNKAAESSAA